MDTSEHSGSEDFNDGFLVPVLVSSDPRGLNVTEVNNANLKSSRILLLMCATKVASKAF